MATRQQRRRRLEMARHHQATQRRRLRAALQSLPVVASGKEIERHMTERGFEQDMRTGKWHAARPGVTLRSAQGHTTWAGIMAKRKQKGRR